MPSSSGPTLSPSPPSLWQTGAVLRVHLLAAIVIGFGLFERVEAVFDQAAKLLVARGEVGGELGDLVVEVVNILLRRAIGDERAPAAGAAKLCRR